MPWNPDVKATTITLFVVVTDVKVVGRKSVLTPVPVFILVISGSYTLYISWIYEFVFRELSYAIYLTFKYQTEVGDTISTRFTKLVIVGTESK